MTPAALLEHAADDPLGTTVAVDVTEVDQVDAGIERPLDDPPRFVFRRHVAEVARPETERRDLQAGAAEGSVVHVRKAPHVRVLGSLRR